MESPKLAEVTGVTRADTSVTSPCFCPLTFWDQTLTTAATTSGLGMSRLSSLSGRREHASRRLPRDTVPRHAVGFRMKQSVSATAGGCRVFIR